MKQHWITQRLDTLKYAGSNKNQAGLARSLKGNSDPSVVTKIIKGDRKVQMEEIGTIADYLEMPAESIFSLVSGIPLSTDPQIGGADRIAYDAELLSASAHDVLTCAMEEYVPNFEDMPDDIIDELVGAILIIYEQSEEKDPDMSNVKDRENITEAAHNVVNFITHRQKRA